MVSTLVRYTPTNRVLDLACLNSADYELIGSLHNEIGRGDRTLICLQAGSGDAGEMYIRLRGGQYWAVHFAGGGHGSHEVARESDEHRQQKDYWQRAAQDAGYEASTEHSTGRGTILDVAITGPRKTGVEIQHSYGKMKVVKARTTKSFRAGWLPVWFLDTDRRPDWYHHVPSVNSNPRSWSSLPPRRAATAVGLTKFTATKCLPGEFDRCPAGHRRACGGWHPQREPWGGLTVDDVAERVPAEQIVPMRDSRGFVHLVSPESLLLYTNLTESDATYLPTGKGPRSGLPSRTTPCTNPHLQPSPPTHCACGQAIYPLGKLRRVREDLCERCRITLGLPSPYLPL